MFTEVLLTIIICVLIAFLFLFIWRDNKSTQMSLPIIYLSEISTKKIKPEFDLNEKEIKEIKKEIKEEDKKEVKDEVKNDEK